MFVGVEIGGTKLQIALGKPNGEIIRTVRGKVNLEKGSKGILEWIKQQLDKILSESNTPIKAIGVGFGGPIDSKSGVILQSVQVAGWEKFNLKEWFENTFSTPTGIYNDSSAAGWGEYILGSGRRVDQFFYTNIGSGIGGAVIVNGELYDGQGFGAGELGQVRIADWTSNKCGYDEKLEALCSGWAIENRLRTNGYVNADSKLLEMCSGDISDLNCRMLGEAAKLNDAFAINEIDQVAKGMSMALANVLCLLQPELIAIGGGVSLIGDPLLNRINKHTETRQFISNKDRYNIVQCELGEAIVLQGAILLAVKDVEKGELSI